VICDFYLSRFGPVHLLPYTIWRKSVTLRENKNGGANKKLKAQLKEPHRTFEPSVAELQSFLTTDEQT